MMNNSMGFLRSESETKAWQSVVFIQTARTGAVQSHKSLKMMRHKAQTGLQSDVSALFSYQLAVRTQL